MYFKKPNFWDDKIGLLSSLLLPFTFFVKINNFLNSKRKKFISKKLKTICVGNIYVGGTGKTPFAIKLHNLLKKNKNVATAKKYYPSQKDEEMLLKKKTNFLTASNRKKILELAVKKKIEIVIFDDGLQDNLIDYNVKIVCFDSKSAIGNGLLIPAGPLREKLTSLIKYDAVIIKCNDKDPIKLIKSIKKYCPRIKIFKADYQILNLNKIDRSKNYYIYSGIGNPKSFESILKKNKIKIAETAIYPDHYTYSNKNFVAIINEAKKYNAEILTTEKDYVKVPYKFKKYFQFIKLDLVLSDEKKFMKFLKLKLND